MERIKNLTGKRWGELAEIQKESVLKNAVCVDGVDGNETVADGECICDIGEYSIPGKIIDGEIKIDKDAKFYNPIG